MYYWELSTTESYVLLRAKYYWELSTIKYYWELSTTESYVLCTTES